MSSCVIVSLTDAASVAFSASPGRTAAKPTFGSADSILTSTRSGRSVQAYQVVFPFSHVYFVHFSVAPLAKSISFLSISVWESIPTLYVHFEYLLLATQVVTSPSLPVAVMVKIASFALEADVGSTVATSSLSLQTVQSAAAALFSVLTCEPFGGMAIETSP